MFVGLLLKADAMLRVSAKSANGTAADWTRFLSSTDILLCVGEPLPWNKQECRYFIYVLEIYD